MSVLKTSREIPARVEQVFTAISDAERLAQWWGPAGFTNTFSVCEFVQDGRWELTMRGPDGKDYPNQSRFAEIDALRKVVIDHISAPQFQLTITLTETTAGTLVEWEQAFESEEVARKIAQFVGPANEQNLDRLTAEALRGN
ncbi:MAG TPA: SRPBCC domain-containing protein [Terracidiphilus sp.]|nr:SRPBCC domain-containing protein [Terracidiphilus sp.]